MFRVFAVYNHNYTRIFGKRVCNLDRKNHLSGRIGCVYITNIIFKSLNEQKICSFHK